MKKIIAISAAAVCMMMGLASCNKTENQQKADQAKEVVDEAADKADSLQAAQTAEEAEQAVK